MDSTTDATAQKLSQSLMQFHKTFMQFHRGTLNQHVAGCKMSEIGVLLLISKQSKSIKVSEISKMMHVTSPSITQVLKRLEANGLVERHVDPADRRTVGITLTEQGEAVAHRAHETFSTSFHGLIDYLGEEQSSQFASLLYKSSCYFNEKMSTMPQSFWNGEGEI
jgi:DNA-binding MarR family transcriptional regulator